jgi:hypothetical protein
MQRSPNPEAATAQVKEPVPVGPAGCCGGGALWGWSPPRLAADTAFKRRVDRVQPRTGVAALAFFAAVVALLNVGSSCPGGRIWPRSGWRLVGGRLVRA